MSRLSLIRFALAGIFALLFFGFILPPGYTQPGRPPGMPGFPQMPPAPGGMPGGAGGHNGMPGGRPPGGFGGQTGSVWSCSGCGAVLGHGPIKPGFANCPKCGARFSNTIGGQMMNQMDSMKQQMDSMVPPVGLPTNSPTPTQFSPEAGTSGSSGSGSSSSDSTPPFSSESTSESNSTKWIIGGAVILSVLIICGTVLAVVLILNSSNKQKGRPRRIRRYIEDDD